MIDRAKFMVPLKDTRKFRLQYGITANFGFADPSAPMSLADAAALRNARQYEEALAILEPLLAAAPMNAQLLVEIADCRRKLNKERSAIEHYERALAVDARNLDAHNSLGIIYGKNRRDFVRARHHFQSMVEFWPKEPKGFVNLAWLEVQLENYRQAMKVYEQLLSVDTDRAGVYSTLASLALQLHDMDEAENYILLALDADDRSPRVLKSIERVEQAMKRTVHPDTAGLRFKACTATFDICASTVPAVGHRALLRAIESIGDPRLSSLATYSVHAAKARLGAATDPRQLTLIENAAIWLFTFNAPTVLGSSHRSDLLAIVGSGIAKLPSLNELVACWSADATVQYNIGSTVMVHAPVLATRDLASLLEGPGVEPRTMLIIQSRRVVDLSRYGRHSSKELAIPAGTRLKVISAIPLEAGLTYVRLHDAD